MPDALFLHIKVIKMDPTPAKRALYGAIHKVENNVPYFILVPEKEGLQL